MQQLICKCGLFRLMLVTNNYLDQRNKFVVNRWLDSSTSGLVLRALQSFCFLREVSERI